MSPEELQWCWWQEPLLASEGTECHLDPLDARSAGWSWQEAGLVSGTAVRMELPYPAPPAPQACFPA